MHASNIPGLHVSPPSPKRFGYGCRLCKRRLGLRLVKRSQLRQPTSTTSTMERRDGAQHLWTTFPYGWGVPVGVHGAADRRDLVLGATMRSLGRAPARSGRCQEGAASRFDEEVLAFTIVVSSRPITMDRDEITLDSGIKLDRAILRLYSVTLLIRHPRKPSIDDRPAGLRAGERGRGSYRMDQRLEPAGQLISSLFRMLRSHEWPRHRASRRTQCGSGSAAQLVRRNHSSNFRTEGSVLLHSIYFRSRRVRLKRDRETWLH
jgi:hypothetical protein